MMNIFFNKKLNILFKTLKVKDRKLFKFKTWLKTVKPDIWLKSMLTIN